MCKNAQIFNEPGSIIYKDARVILRTVKQKNFELMAAQKAAQNRGTRSRSRGPGKNRQYASEVSSCYNYIPYARNFRPLTNIARPLLFLI